MTTDNEPGEALEAYWEYDADGNLPKPTLRECPLCPNGGQPYFTRTVNGTNMIYVGCSQCGLELKAALLMVTPVKEQPSKDILAIWNTRSAPLAAVGGDVLRNLLNQFLLDKYGCTIEHHRMKVLKHFVEWAGSAAAASSLPAEPPPNEAHRCPHCGRRMVSEFDEDVGFWRECANCDYREAVSNAPAEPLQPEGEQEPSLEDLAGEAAALLEQLNGINGDAVLLRANQVAFALRAGIKSSRQRHNLARADGYNDGFRQGKQSRATLPPETPSDAAMRAAREWLRSERGAMYAAVLNSAPPQTLPPRLQQLEDDAVERLAAIITRHLAARPNDAEQEFLAASVAVWREIDRLSALPEGYKGLPPETDPRKRELTAWERYRAVLDAAANTSPETPVRGEAQKCVKCGHGARFSGNPQASVGEAWFGRCTYTDWTKTNPKACGCKCEFAAPVPAAGDDEGDAEWPKRLTIIRYDDGGFSATQHTPLDKAKFTRVYYRK